MTLRGVAVCYRRRLRIGSGRAREFWALRDISFDLRQGEVLGIVGRNGAGKSTLLRLIAGILRPDRGTIARFSPQIASLLSMQVGFANRLTGRENAILSGMLLGLTYREVLERMADVIAYSGLTDVIDEPISVYSSGMRARLGFSVAYFADPEIILLDEVLGAGDAEFRRKSGAAMRERIRADRTVVLVSHNMATVRELCDRAVFIDGGVSVAQGDIGEVLSRYTEALAARGAGSHEA